MGFSPWQGAPDLVALVDTESSCLNILFGGSKEGERNPSKYVISLASGTPCGLDHPAALD